ncbi:hypothetical protein pb186bvf_004662 [Paramecium bursaria]
MLKNTKLYNWNQYVSFSQLWTDDATINFAQQEDNLSMIYLFCTFSILQAKQFQNQSDKNLLLSGPLGPHGPVDPFDYCLDNKCQNELKDCSGNLDCQLTIQTCQDEYQNRVGKKRKRQAKKVMSFKK